MISTPTNPLEKRSFRHRLDLFVIVRILFGILEKVNSSLLIQAKQVLKDCDKQKKKGNPDFQNLAVSIETHLRRTVGEIYWNEALSLFASQKRDRLKSKQTRATPVSIPSPALPQNCFVAATQNEAISHMVPTILTVPQPHPSIQTAPDAFMSAAFDALAAPAAAALPIQTQAPYLMPNPYRFNFPNPYMPSFIPFQNSFATVTPNPILYQDASAFESRTESITPIMPDGQLDFQALLKLLEQHQNPSSHS
uniref:Uncharacterized protein n=1 Tax=Ditylum brightwellii TaxID=49249 RepID=A0A7S4UZN7_9STRA|mmetsp:Transcript_18133/g.24066  ORF Transcript_18133/g.24066 Transcript_18133/m.24066 type:complete len:251 (+) Transcript_18133:202-954(+)